MASIHRPSDYETNALPLRHSAFRESVSLLARLIVFHTAVLSRVVWAHLDLFILLQAVRTVVDL